MKTKKKYYGIYSKNDNFLHGVFPLNKEGYQKAKEYLSKIDKNKKAFYIKIK
jgi:hypothetical protein